MGRRLCTNIAIAGMIAVGIIVAAMWIYAATNGDVRQMIQWHDTPPEFRGNHGPWRHTRVLSVLYDFAMFATLFGIVPMASIGAATEGSRRSTLVALLAAALLVRNCLHFPLFD